jgi:hypothetical protein
MRKSTIAVIGLVLVIWLTGCAHYGAKDVMPKMNEPSDRAKLSVKASGGLSVSAFLLPDEEAARCFGEELAKEGIYAVFVEIQNNAAVDVRLSVASLKLNGGQFTPITKDEVYAVMKRGWFLRSTAGWFLGLYVGAPIMAYQTSQKNKEILQDIENKILKFGEIKKGKTEGFLFFKSSAKILGSSSGKLSLIFEMPELAEYVLDVARQAEGKEG